MMRENFPVKNTLLKDYIRDYWIVEFDGMEESQEMIVPPMGFPVMHLHYGEESNFYKHKHLTCQSVIIGQATRHIIVYPSEKVRLIGVNFTPYGLYNLFGISPGIVTNSAIECHQIIENKKLNELTILLKNNRDKDTCILAVEQLLIEQRKNEIQTFRYLDSLVDRIEKENGLLHTKTLLNNSISSRTLQRYFQKVIGVSPKSFCQILRHKFIMQQCYHNPDFQWNDIVLKGYYYDYSHFYKDFHHFSGHKPAGYLALKNQYAADMLRV